VSVSIIIASIPPRFKERRRAINSAIMQTMKPANILVGIDYSRKGAAAMRDSLIKAVDTKYVCILDDDDWLLPNHVETLYRAAENTGADLVYPWHKVSRGDAWDSFLIKWKGVQWNNNNPHQVPVTWIAKTESIRKVGGFSSDFNLFSDEIDEQGARIGEDYLLIKKFVNNNMKIVHINEDTWVWNVDSNSTQGRPDRW